jgi:hypothetical protein
MKKIVLLLGVIGVMVLMTSCLKGSDNFREGTIVYITTTTDNRVVYGRAFRSLFNLRTVERLITTQGMQTGMIGTTSIDVGNFYYMVYSGSDTEYGHTSLGENGTAQNVVVEGISDRIEEQLFNIWTEVPEASENLSFINIGPTAIFPDLDYWIFDYSYIGSESGTPTVTFYRRPPASESSNDIEIDVRIEHINTSGNQGARGRFLALNVEQLRREYQQTNTREVNVRFHYYVRQGQTQTLQSSPQYPLPIPGTSTSEQ